MRKFRYIEQGHGVDSLTKHEKNELEEDFDIDLDRYHVIVPLTKEEWETLLLVEETYEKLIGGKE